MACFRFIHKFPILLVLQFNFIGSVPVEPVCSKFSYDEQLLEKMVRMEFFVENMKKDVETSVSNVLDVMDDIKGNNSELAMKVLEQQEKIDGMERQAGVLGDTMAKKSIVSDNTKNLTRMEKVIESTSSVRDMKGDIDAMNKKYVDGLSDLSNKVANLEKNMKDLDKENRQMVAFNVMDAVSADPLKFSKIVLNEGNAYNKETGIFTAPCNGVYLFNVHICGRKEEDIEYYIKVGVTSIVTGEFRVPREADDTKCTSTSAVAMVRKDDMVQVGGMSFAHLDRNSDDFTSFSGALLKKV